MATEQDHASKALMVLQKAVANALERKRRLGQYAVLWRDGQTVRVPPKQLGSVGQYAPGDFTSPFTVRAPDERPDHDGNPRESGKEGGP
jgi:hypothetical protein